MAINSVFNPAGIVVTVGHVTVSNLTADDGVKIEMQGDGMQFTVGLDGALVPSLTANRSAKITLSVMQGSTTNCKPWLATAHRSRTRPRCPSRSSTRAVACALCSLRPAT